MLSKQSLCGCCLMYGNSLHFFPAPRSVYSDELGHHAVLLAWLFSVDVQQLSPVSDTDGPSVMASAAPSIAAHAYGMHCLLLVCSDKALGASKLGCL